MLSSSLRGGFAIVGLGVSLAACGGAPGKAASAPAVPLAPAGVYVADDVAEGYGAYALILERWGRWSPDATYGVHWCPDPGQVSGFGLPFRPYTSHGHWGASEDSKFGAPPGAPFWMSDDADTWGEITTHHGWWIQREVNPSGAARAADWCWVPGAQETPARVVWRDGGGFVGWAPEPPAWIDDGDEGVYADFAWTYEALGSVLELALEDQVLTGDACDAAMVATSPSQAVRSSPTASRFAHVGPGRSVVAAAKQELLARIQANGSAINAAMVAANVAKPAKGSTGDGPSSSSPAKEAKAHEVDDAPMPHAMLFMPVLLREGPRPRGFSSVAVEAFAHPASSGAHATGGGGGFGSSHAISWGGMASSSHASSPWFSGLAGGSHASVSHSTSSSSSSSSHSSSSSSHASTSHHSSGHR